MNHWPHLLFTLQGHHIDDSHPIPIHSRPGMGATIGGGEMKMGKITTWNKRKEDKEWVDLRERIFKDIREGMFDDMGLDEMIQWVEQKLRESQ